uniref:Uncharacterized protein n=1 Tax=viral metagenome TaxID=1070528 RepID=A0A6C0JQN8_9ZZZZ
MNLENHNNFCRIEYDNEDETETCSFEYRLRYEGEPITIKIKDVSYIIKGHLFFLYWYGRKDKRSVAMWCLFDHCDWSGLTSNSYVTLVDDIKTREEAEIEMIKIMIDVNTQLAKCYGVEWNLSIYDYPKRLEELVSERIFGLDGPFYNQGVL